MAGARDLEEHAALLLQQDLAVVEGPGQHRPGGSPRPARDAGKLRSAPREARGPRSSAVSLAPASGTRPGLGLHAGTSPTAPLRTTARRYSCPLAATGGLGDGPPAALHPGVTLATCAPSEQGDLMIVGLVIGLVVGAGAGWRRRLERWPRHAPRPGRGRPGAPRRGAGLGPGRGALAAGRARAPSAGRPRSAGWRSTRCAASSWASSPSCRARPSSRTTPSSWSWPTPAWPDAQQAARGDLDQRTQAIEQLLTPLREQLGRYEQGLRLLELERQKAYTGLSEQVRTPHPVPGQAAVRDPEPGHGAALAGHAGAGGARCSCGAWSRWPGWSSTATSSSR